ncbi:hypothetical protein [Allochromatium tepidum]|uniref:Uncharacterized protein n=1 Tax=Allochromatium tepidum TaxID=553982 RepID=A0ABN6GEA0_9GAMM|nr:hypothetical protein [Allochromatium tepidum]BCU08287.1 hypothetical protein Atep_29640 [Allochromatium tepidum]
MRWLWLVSVGVTDVQCPVWTKDDNGLWQGPQRFQLGRGGVRKTHEGLLTLLRRERIRFDPEIPPLIEREPADRLRFEFEHDPADDEFLAALHPADYRLSPQADTIPNDQEERLPLYCPKVAPLADKVHEIIGRDTVSVLVLNTRRAEDFGPEARDEPIASGPLVARYLAERLGLTWLDSDGRLPETFASGSATWIDILTEREAMEESEAQGRVVERLNAALSLWSGTGSDERRVLVTTSGGMPPLKPLIERVPAIHVGQPHVTLLDQSERRGRDAPVAASVLNYGERVAERETLRFHCTEALRAGDYAGAYGLARRAGQCSWADAVCNRLGSLLELPGQPLHIKGRVVEPFVLHAVQVETRLCMGDLTGALLRMGPFVESATWKLMASDARIRALGLKFDRANESLLGTIPQDHPLLSDEAGYLRRFEDKAPAPSHSDGLDRHRINGLTWEWPKWMAEPDGGQRTAALALIQVCMSYNSDQWGTSPRQYRNLLAHGADQAVSLGEIETCLKKRGLIVGAARPFGDGFLATERIATLLDELGMPDLVDIMRTYLADLLNRVIRG